MKLGLFAGLAGLDIVFYQKDIPVENTKSKTNNYKVLVGGPAANAAITYTMLGGKALLITCIGNSTMGKIIKKELSEDYGVEIIDCAGTNEISPNISSIAVNMTNASRTIWSGQQSFEMDDKININKLVKNAAFCFSDCNLPEVSIKVLQEAKNEAIPIILDAGSWKDHFEFYLSVANDVIASSDCKPLSSSNEDFITVASQFGVENIAVTNGENSICWKSKTEGGMINPIRIDAKDTLGAGDVLHGAYCYFKVEQNLSFQEALKKAAEVASLSVQYYGPRQGVKEYLKR